MDAPHQDPRPAHQHARRLRHLRVALGVQGEHPVVRLGDRRQRLVDLAGQRTDVRRTRACGQGLAGVARPRVQLGGVLERLGAVRTETYRLVVGDLRAVPRRQLDALHLLGQPGHPRPRLHGMRLERVGQPLGLGEQDRQVGFDGLLNRSRSRGPGRRRGHGGGGTSRPYAQRQPFHQGLPVHTRACPLADVRRAVALVEARGQRQGLHARVLREFRRRPLPPGRPGHPLTVETQLGQTPHEQHHHAEELQLAVRMPLVREVRRPLREQLQAPRLVAGQRAELDVVGVGAPHALHGPHQPEAPQMVRAGLLRAAEPQQRHQGRREHRVRLVRARVLALQDRRPQRERLRVAAPLRLPPALSVQLARVTVGHGVPVRGQPRGERPLRPLHVAHVRGHAELGAAHRPRGVPGEPVAVLHLAEPLLDRRQRHVRLVEHAGRHPLEDPVQRVRLVLVEVLGPFVPHAQQPRERDEHLRLLGAVVVDLQLVPERLDHGERDAEPLGLHQQLLRARVAGRALRLLAVLRHRPAEGVEVRDLAHQ